MARVEEKHVHKGGKRPESFYDYITSRFLSKPLVPILIKVGIHNPNTISIISFLMLLSSAAALLFLDQVILFNRIAVALLIELSFTLDCSDGQLARTLNKSSIFGGWLDKYLDRIGEMALYTVIGFSAWRQTGYFLYFVLGFSTGFLFTYYSLIWALKDSVFFEELRNSNYDLEPYRASRKDNGSFTQENNVSKRILGKRFLKKTVFTDILTATFFFLNIGIGERYFYPVLFIILNRLPLMLVIVSALFFMRAMNVTFILIGHIARNKIGIRID
jgi:phosphatidylglycerophosphate synthase